MRRGKAPHFIWEQQTVFSPFDLRHRITIQRATETQAADGSVVQTWGSFAVVNAYYEAIEGGESFVAQGITASVVYKVIMRELAGVVPKMRLAFGSRVFEIESVLPFRQDQMRMMKLMCVEVDV